MNREKEDEADPDTTDTKKTQILTRKVLQEKYWEDRGSQRMKPLNIDFEHRMQYINDP